VRDNTQLNMMSVLQRRLFSSSRAAFSHIGSSPIFITPEVKLDQVEMLIPNVIPKGTQKIILNNLLSISGPRGEINLQIPEFLTIDSSAETNLKVHITDAKNKIQKSLWGTYRSLINNAVIGVTDGHSSTLRFKGTGYRVMLEKDPRTGVEWVKMKVGRCNVEGLPIPEGITCETPSQTLLVLNGANKQKLNLFAARLRNMRPPEPYKGKGIYFNGETIKLKAKKVK
jgi:large subunit ribosomal protein L6